ncbi:hypothetical protein EKO04_006040 [Ascochyta lentis]|uniref:Apple domain-containing protein n=1 Tax=Ascochyta lentis TaxID=205686 RepID=A0A8H7MIN0_9PLEO|nr:hypothetical protein EKO04_006040 [Ascochyta lentis]
MHINSILSALVLLSGVSAQVSTKSLVTCITKQGPKSTSPVRTTSKVLTIPWYAYRVTTYTPSTTTTPATSTQTVSSTTTIRSTTTLPVETDTVTETSSVTSTDLTTVTTTTISTALTTFTVSSTDTTTIAATPGFVPVETSIPGTMKRRTADSAADNALEERQTQGRTQIGVKNGKLVCNPAVYPQSVKCAGLVAVITTSVRTKTASKTRVVTAPTPIVTSTTIFTTSTTVTETPARASTTTTVTTTISTSSTTSVTETSVTTVTATATFVAPQATQYAACADDNIITTIDGQGISSAYVNNNIGQSFVSAGSAYECCVACINTAGCAAAAYFNDGNTCDLISVLDGTCSQSSKAVFISGGSAASFAFSNGNCGSVSRP